MKAFQWGIAGSSRTWAVDRRYKHQPWESGHFLNAVVKDLNSKQKSWEPTITGLEPWACLSLHTAPTNLLLATICLYILPPASTTRASTYELLVKLHMTEKHSTLLPLLPCWEVLPVRSHTTHVHHKLAGILTGRKSEPEKPSSKTHNEHTCVCTKTRKYISIQATDASKNLGLVPYPFPLYFSSCGWKK